MREATVLVRTIPIREELKFKGTHGKFLKTLVVIRHFNVYDRVPIRGRHAVNTSAPYLGFGNAR